MEAKSEDPSDYDGCIVVPAILWGLILASALTMAIAFYLHAVGAHAGSDQQPDSIALFDLVEVTFLSSLGCGIGAISVLVVLVALPRRHRRTAWVAVAAGFGAAWCVPSLGVFPTV